MPDIKRTKYFDQQLLVLDDFKDEQEYHISMRQQHNRVCHTPGVATGLEVVKVSNDKVRVTAGLAINIIGQEIVLDADTELSLSGFSQTDAVIITIKYQIVESKPIGSPPQYTRVLEKSELKSYKIGAGVTIPADEVVLATIIGIGTNLSVDLSRRKFVGATSFDNQNAAITARSLRLASNTLNSSEWPSLTCDATSTINLRGSATISGLLSVLTSTGASASFQSTQPRAFIGLSGSEGSNNRVEIVNNPGGTLTLLTIGQSGSPNEVLNITKQGNVGIGTTTPQAKLEISAGAENQTKPVVALRISGPNSPGNLNSAQDIRWSFSAAGSAMIRGYRGGSWDTYLQFLTNSQTKNSDNPDVRMTISHDGNVTINGNLGVGVSVPAHNLHCAGPWFVVEGPQAQQAYIGSAGLAVNVGSFNANVGKVDMWNRVNNSFMDLGARELLLVGWGNEMPYIGGDGYASDVEIGSLNPNIKLVSLYNRKSNIFMNLTAGDISAREITCSKITAPAKVGYVTDKFINVIGEQLEEGDIVIVGQNQSSLCYGTYDAVPIPEVDFTQKAYDVAVCGIVCQLDGEVESASESKSKNAKSGKKNKMKIRQFSLDEVEQYGHGQVLPGQIGLMVTLGAYAHCKVDADIAPIEIGDLLTTSPTKGHAQKVLDVSKATGAIIGKALGSLKKGKGKIPVLVTLH